MAKLSFEPVKSLSHKGLALVVIPLFFQCVLFLSAMGLYGQAQAEADKAYKASKISNTVNQLVRDLFDIASLSPGEASRIADTGFEGDANRIWQDIQNLKTAVTGDSEKEAIVANTAEAAISAHQILIGLHNVYVNDGPLIAFEMLKESSKELRLCIKRMVSRDLLTMAQREERVEQLSPLVQSKLRQQIEMLLVTSLVFSIALTIFIAVMFYRGIIRRLQIIVDNSYRLASSMPLNPPLKRKDEIGVLDHTFHNMANALEYVKEREKALINHSLDLICSIDIGLRFAALNPACEEILGFKPDDLLNSHVSSTVIEEDWNYVRNSLFKMISGEIDKSELETHMRRKDGNIIDVLLKVHWVESEKRLFCVVNDITIRKQAERMRQEVIAMVSHDLRTPLATLSSYFEMLDVGVFGELTERGTHLAKVAERNISRMLSLTNDLLDLEKSKSGLLEVQCSNVKLNELLDQATKSVVGLALRQEVQLEVSHTNLIIFADANRIMQVLVNLISNAIKFSPKQGVVRVGAEEKNGMAYISVSDQGRGVPEQLKQTIFERFHQVEIADAVDKGGSGLGLAICKAIVELHGGQIKVEDNSQAGSTFSFNVAISNSTNKFSTLNAA